MKNDKEKLDIQEEKETLGSWTKEMIKPENIAGVYKTTEDMMKHVWDEE